MPQPLQNKPRPRRLPSLAAISLAVPRLFLPISVNLCRSELRCRAAPMPASPAYFSSHWYIPDLERSPSPGLKSLFTTHLRPFQESGKNTEMLWSRSASIVHPAARQLTQNGQYDIFNEEKGRRLLPGQSPLLNLHQRRALVINNYTRRICLNFRRPKDFASSCCGRCARPCSDECWGGV